MFVILPTSLLLFITPAFFLVQTTDVGKNTIWPSTFRDGSSGRVCKNPGDNEGLPLHTKHPTTPKLNLRHGAHA